MLHTCRFAGFSPELFAHEFNTRALVGFRRTQRPDLCCDMPDELLVDAGECDDRVAPLFCLGCNLDLLRQLHDIIMRVTEAHLKAQAAGFSTVAHADKLKVIAVAF